MKPAVRTHLIRLGNRPCQVVALLAALLVTATDRGRTAEKQPSRKPAGKELGPTSVEIRFEGGGCMKLLVLDERLEMNTPYGRLHIPVADIHQIEFGWRIADEVARQVQTAVTDLGDASFKRREAACEELAALEERAYPALLRAAKHTDPEVARRANGLLEKLRRSVPAERLEMRPNDVVHTADSKFTGRLTAAAIRVRTRPFGDQSLKLADIRSLCSPLAGKPKEVDALPDPGNLSRVNAQAGKTLVFRVTGARAGTPGAWGTGTYTMDSPLAVAAVHTGILQSGQTGVVRVTLLGPVPAYTASTQNGISTSGYGQYPGYRIEQ
jgi:hypothetical protein